MDAIYEFVICCVILYGMIIENEWEKNLKLALFDGLKRYDLPSIIYGKHQRIKKFTSSLQFER